MCMSDFPDFREPSHLSVTYIIEYNKLYTLLSGTQSLAVDQRLKQRAQEFHTTIVPTQREFKRYNRLSGTGT